MKHEECNNLKIEAIKEIEDIKEEINAMPSIITDDGFKLMGELLKFFRDSRDMKMLMLCRQIKKIETSNSNATIIADDAVLDEVYQNEEAKTKLKAFFKSIGLGFKIYKKDEDLSSSEVLREWLGEKLIIK